MTSWLGAGKGNGTFLQCRLLGSFVPVLFWALLSLCSWFPAVHKDTIPNIRNKCSQERNCSATVLIPTIMFLWEIYILLWSVCLFCWSLTDTWMCKWGLKPHNSFVWIDKFKFLCSVGSWVPLILGYLWLWVPWAPGSLGSSIYCGRFRNDQHVGKKVGLNQYLTMTQSILNATSVFRRIIRIGCWAENRTV